jgi:aspartyl-tRNA(Asn)/glutamyl-tRNA(Gln) amidotransferase subunit A
MEYAIPVYYITANAEASSNLARYDGIRYTYRSPKAHTVDEIFDFSRSEGFGAEVKRRILLGTYVLSSGYYDAFYGKAQKVRRLIYNDFMRVFSEVDAILTPTSPAPAFKKGERTANPLAMYLSDIYTVSVNLAGLPGISIPCGFTKSRLPIGLQLIGKPFEESTILSIANVFEQQHSFNLEVPKF